MLTATWQMAGISPAWPVFFANNEKLGLLFEQKNLLIW